MPGTDLNLDLDAGLATKIKQACERTGLSPEAYATMLLEEMLADFEDFAWGDDPASYAPPTDAQGRSVEEVVNGFLSELDRRLG